MTTFYFDTPVTKFARELDRALYQSPLGRIIDGISEAATTPSAERSQWRPAVDIADRGSEVRLLMDIPGLGSGDIELTLEDRVLTVKGTRNIEKDPQEACHLCERPSGNFVRRFNMPEEIDETQVGAKVTNGVLEILLKKKAAVSPKKIVINAG